MQLAEALSRGRPLLADGAMGSNLIAMGLPLGQSPELWIDRHPDRVQGLHQAFVDAGADLILTNTFGANARRLRHEGLERRVGALNRAAARLARAVADATPRPVVVAGTVGPTGDFYTEASATESEAVEVFAEQIEALADGGVDVIWIETMSSPAEIRAAAMAAIRLARPFTLTASFDHDGRTLTGLDPQAFAALAHALPHPPEALGANCGTGPNELLDAISAIAARSPDSAVIAKANAGLPRPCGGGWRYPAGTEQMARYARQAVEAGARVVGGCCGTTPAHLSAMRRALDALQCGPG